MAEEGYGRYFEGYAYNDDNGDGVDEGVIKAMSVIGAEYTHLLLFGKANKSSLESRLLYKSLNTLV